MENDGADGYHLIWFDGWLIFDIVDESDKDQCTDHDPYSSLRWRNNQSSVQHSIPDPLNLIDTLS